MLVHITVHSAKIDCNELQGLVGLYRYSLHDRLRLHKGGGVASLWYGLRGRNSCCSGCCSCFIDSYKQKNAVRLQHKVVLTIDLAKTKIFEKKLI